MARSSTATASTRSIESPRFPWRPPPAWQRWELAAGAGVLLLGLLLRLNGYADLPSAKANADEWAWAWAGMSLLTTGVPTGWSYLYGYHAYHVIHLHGAGYPLVTPWLDHPPLFPMVVGASELLFGQHILAAASTAAIRLPAVVFGGASIGLTQVVGRRLLGPAAALIGATLLALSPAAVLLSREVESEALLAPLLLVAIWLLHRLGTGEGGRGAEIALAVVCALAVLTKVPGLAVGAAAVVALVWLERWRAAGLAAAGAAAGLAAYALYGAHYDWPLFLTIINSQGVRRAGVMGAFEFITAPAGVNARLRDGWWLLGWIAIAALVAGRAPARKWLLAWPALAYLVAILVLADERVTARYGWYHIAVYPEIYLAAGFIAWRAISQPDAPSLALLLALGGATATSLWLGLPWNPPAWLLLPILAVLVLPAALRRPWPPARWLAAGAFALLLLGMVVEALNLDLVLTLS
jgi:4-amino-4-deoxy-L-arabinose transferase-like glycosyltransferase